MFRPTLLLLIVTMLTCPLRCGAQETALAFGADATVSGHHCCDGCPSGLGEQSAPGSDQGCECGSCVCKGAILQTSFHVLAASVIGFASVPPVVDSCLGVQPTSLRLDSTASCLGMRPVGRAARIAHQSLLI